MKKTYFFQQKRRAGKLFFPRSFLLLVFSFFSIVSLAYAATTIGNNIFTSGTLTSQGKAYLTGGVTTPVLNATSSLIDNLTVDQNTSLATTTISNILTTQAPVNFTNGMVSVKAPFKIEKLSSYSGLSLGGYSGVYILNHYAYITGLNGLEIVDISNSVNPVLVGNYNTGSYTDDVYVSGHYAYVADGNGLEIVDISNPAAPTLVGNYNTAGSSYGIYIAGHYAYVADGNGLEIVDISNPASPALVGNYTRDSFFATSYQVVVQGKYAYLTYGSSGLDIIDISNPASPVLVGNYDTTGYATGVYVSGHYAYVADGANGLDIIDVSNPASPVLVGNYVTSKNVDDVYVAGHYAYLVDNYGNLYIVDISNPTNPLLAEDYIWSTTYYSSSVGLFLYGNKVYIGGLLILSLSGLSSPTANLGNIQSNNLTVTENTNLNQLNVNESLTVGKNALFNNDLTIQGNLNVLNNATINKALSATDISSDYATTSQYIALPTVKFIPTATPTNPKLGQCFMDNGAKPQVSCYDGAAWHTLW